MAALITYDITQKDIRSAAKNLIFFGIGVFSIFFLCKSGFEPVAWVLLAIPPFFFTALLALLVVTQIIRTNVTYDDGSTTSLTGDRMKELLGLKPKGELEPTNGIVDRLVGKPFQDACKALPTLPSKEQIEKELNAGKVAMMNALKNTMPDISDECNTCS